MKFKVDIKNFGKIEHATIQVNNLTVLAGKNNVGKSFVSKALYAFFRAMNIDHLRETLGGYIIDSLLRVLDTLEDSTPYHGTVDDKFIADARDILSSLRDRLLTVQNTSIFEKLEFVKTMEGNIKLLQQVFTTYKQQVIGKKKKFAGIKDYLEVVEEKLNRLQQYIERELATPTILPCHDSKTLRHIEFLLLSEKRVLVIVVINDYEVQNRIIQTSRPYSATELESIANYLNTTFMDKDITVVRENLLREQSESHQEIDNIMQAIIEMADKAFVSDTDTIAKQTNLNTVVEKISGNLGEAFKNELKQNFQVSKLQQLKRVKSAEFSSFELGIVGKIFIKDESVVFSIESSGLDMLQKLSQVIYIESPIYWKLKSALEFNRLNVDRILRRRDKASQYLTGVPNYFYDLANFLKLRSTNEPQFKDILEGIEQEIGGRLHLSDEGDLVFQTKAEGTHPISITALGVANLGMIAMLLEKNLIDEGTFLFIDEPEAHLHPAWQVVLIRTLYQLAAKGVNIVITTHSVDMLKYLEVLIKKDAEAKELIALNHLGSEGQTLNEDVEFEEKIGLMKQDLLEPFYNLYMEGL